MRNLWRWFWGPTWAEMQKREAAEQRRQARVLISAIDHYLRETKP